MPQPDETQRLNRIEDWLDEGRRFRSKRVGVVAQQGWRDFELNAEGLGSAGCVARWVARKSLLVMRGHNDKGNFTAGSCIGWNWIRFCAGLRGTGDDLFRAVVIMRHCLQKS